MVIHLCKKLHGDVIKNTMKWNPDSCYYIEFYHQQLIPFNISSCVLAFNRQLSDSNTIIIFFYWLQIWQYNKGSIDTCGCIISNEISGHAHTNMYLPPLYSENKSLGTYCVQCIAKINNPISDLSTSSWRFFLFFHIAANNWQDWSITVLLGRDGLANSYQVLWYPSQKII